MLIWIESSIYGRPCWFLELLFFVLGTARNTRNDWMITRQWNMKKLKVDWNRNGNERMGIPESAGSHFARSRKGKAHEYPIAVVTVEAAEIRAHETRCQLRSHFFNSPINRSIFESEKLTNRKRNRERERERWKNQINWMNWIWRVHRKLLRY